MWQNNHVMLQGKIIFYNKKYVRTTKNEATAHKPIRFYYVLLAGKPAPTVPSNQALYQLLWDDPSRSNRSLKWSAPLATPQAKKSKTSSVARPVLPQSVSESPLPP
jgi:hypothetical protein